MCGILASLPATGNAFFGAALELLSHRGPDGSTVWHGDNSVSLGHTRLAIIDTSDGALQPMHYLHLTIVMNGEIYNFKAVRKELMALGHTFTTNSDTEVAIAAYLQWGHNCLNRFNGMWSMIIWDAKNNELFMSRDRFGKKPLFYTHVNGKFVAASEMKALMPFLDNNALHPAFGHMAANVFSYESTSECLIRDIKRFPAASYGIFKNNKLSISRYWNTFENLLDVPDSYETQQEQFFSLFNQSCLLRRTSDVPIAMSLSGGLDSSAIASLAATDIPLKGLSPLKDAFTTSFFDSKFSEREKAAYVCNELALNHHNVVINPYGAMMDATNGYYYFEEIYHTPPYTFTETYRNFQKKGFRVSLEGHGADELFSGYRNFMFLSFLDAPQSQIPEITKTYNQTFSYPDAPHFKKENPLTAYLKTWLWFNTAPDTLNVPFLNPLLRKEMIKKMGHLNYGLYIIFHYSILPVLLRNFDRYSMKHGVEVRMPFMDYRLVNLCFSLPWHAKIRNGYTKAIVRDALKYRIPDMVRCTKAKTGFQAPLHEWMAGLWKEFLMDESASTEFSNSVIINASQLRKKTIKFLNAPEKSFLDAEKLYAAWSPYFWERGFYQKINELSVGIRRL